MREGMKLTDLATDTTEDTEHIRSIFAFAELAKSKTGNGLKFESRYYGDDSHGSVPLIAEYDALHAMFSWYSAKAFAPYADPASHATVEEVIKTVTDYYAKFGYGKLPPEQIVNSLGYRFMNKMNDKAFAFFDLNVKNYPDSPNAFDSMGDYDKAEKPGTSTCDCIRRFRLFALSS